MRKASVYMLPQGKLQQAIPWVTVRDKGGLLLLTKTDAKTGKMVVDVLVSKYPNPTTPYVEAFHPYASMSTLINL